MKKYLLFVAVIGLMASCSADKADEKTPEDWNKIYLENAKKYIASEVKENPGEDGEKIVSFDVMKIDSSHITTNWELEELKMTDLQQEFITQAKYATDLNDIDKAYMGYTTASTQIELDKANNLHDSIESWRARVKNTPKKPTKIKVVYISINFKRANGTVNKGISVPFYFDEDGDLDATMMDAYFN